MNGRLVLGLIAALAAVPAARADVDSAGASGFVLHFEVVAHRDPAATWQRLVRPEYWWSAEHTYTRDARNSVADARRGRLLVRAGCRTAASCATWKSYAAPGHALRLSMGGLGPLQKNGRVRRTVIHAARCR